MKKHVAMVGFWKNKIYVVVRREKTPGLCCFLSAKNQP